MLPETVVSAVRQTRQPELLLQWQSEFSGPNPHAPEAVLVASLQLRHGVADDAWRDAVLWASRHLPVDALSQSSQHLADTRMDVLMLAQWVAGAALGLLNEVRGCVQYAGAAEEAGSVCLWVGFHRPALTRQAVDLVLRAVIFGHRVNAGHVSAALAAEELQQACQQFFLRCRREHPDYQAAILMRAARACGVPWLSAAHPDRYWQFGWGSRSRLFFESASNQDGMLGGWIASSKSESKRFLAALGAPVVPHVLVSDPAALEAASATVGWPCVIKPLDRGGGKGVTANIHRLEALREGFLVARQYSNGPLMVEAHIQGCDHRLMCVRGEFVAAIRREPSRVQGNGKTSIAGLVDQLNQQRSGNMVASSYLRPIVIGAEIIACLATQGWHPEDILPEGVSVNLRSNANLSTGGICTDVTHEVHPHIRNLAANIARASGLVTVGLDYLTTDISRCWQDVGGAFIELNITPGLDAMIAAGLDPLAVGRCVLGDQPGVIPMALLVVAESVLGAVHALLDGCLARIKVAPAGFGWVFGKRVALKDLPPLTVNVKRPWDAVECLLRQPLLQAGVVVATPPQISRWGLPMAGVQQIWCLGEVSLPAAWSQVLSRSVERITKLADANALDEACMEFARQSVTGLPGENA